MNEEFDRLARRVAQMEAQVQQLVEAVTELNEYMGNPIGVMNEESEIGPLFQYERDDEYADEED